MNSVSRRSVATGAAWSIPTIAAVAAAPASAASPIVDCTKSAAAFGSNFVAATWTKLTGTMTANKSAWGDPGGTGTTGSGTEWSINVGNPSITPPDSSLTGLAFYGDTSRQAILRTVSGATGSGTITTPGITTPVVAASGLSTSMSIQSTVPYNGLCPTSAETLQSISIPVTVIWYQGTTSNAPASAPCGLWLNYCYNVPAKGPTGCYSVGPVGSPSASVTSGAQKLC